MLKTKTPLYQNVAKFMIIKTDYSLREFDRQ